MPYQSKEFEQTLAENLALYTMQPDVSGKDLFQTHREISYARYALSQQAQSYAKAIELLTHVLDIHPSEVYSQPKLLTDVMVAINAIEVKSISLIRSVREVTELLGRAVNIDIDKAALSSIVLRLPSLVRESIAQISNDPELAQRISTNLDNRLSDLMIAFRFNPQQQTPESSESVGITFNQYAQLHDTVPTQP